jgi:hypothetical protein
MPQPTTNNLERWEKKINTVIMFLKLIYYTLCLIAGALIFK